MTAKGLTAAYYFSLLLSKSQEKQCQNNHRNDQPRTASLLSFLLEKRHRFQANRFNTSSNWHLNWWVFYNGLWQVTKYLALRRWPTYENRTIPSADIKENNKQLVQHSSSCTLPSSKGSMVWEGGKKRISEAKKRSNICFHPNHIIVFITEYFRLSSETSDCCGVAAMDHKHKGTVHRQAVRVAHFISLLEHFKLHAYQQVCQRTFF